MLCLGWVTHHSTAKHLKGLFKSKGFAWVWVFIFTGCDTQRELSIFFFICNKSLIYLQMERPLSDSKTFHKWLVFFFLFVSGHISSQPHKQLIQKFSSELNFTENVILKMVPEPNNYSITWLHILLFFMHSHRLWRLRSKGWKQSLQRLQKYRHSGKMCRFSWRNYTTALERNKE